MVSPASLDPYSQHLSVLNFGGILHSEHDNHRKLGYLLPANFPQLSNIQSQRAVRSWIVPSSDLLQEVVSHSKKLTKKNKEQLSDMMMLNKQRGGLKALSKEKREKLEAYQHLFYLLQVRQRRPLGVHWAASFPKHLPHVFFLFSCRQTQHTWRNWFSKCHRTNLQSSWTLWFSHSTIMHPIKEKNTYCCASLRLHSRRRSSRWIWGFNLALSIFTLAWSTQW